MDAREWVTAREAIVDTGVKRRTLYAWIESGRVPSRVVDGLTEVELPAVHECMRVHDARVHSREGRRITHPGHSARLALSAEDAALLGAKRARVHALELDRAAMEAQDRLWVARADSETAASNRIARKSGAEVAVMREELELEQVRWRHNQERREAAARVAEIEAQARRRAEADAREAEAHDRLKDRERKHVRYAADWIRRELGESAVLEARSCARRVVNELEPDEPEEVVLAAVRTALGDQFGNRIRTKRVQQLESQRATIKREILHTVLLSGDAEEVRSAVGEALDRELAYTSEPERAKARLTHLATRVRESTTEARLTMMTVDVLKKFVLAARGRS